MQEHRKHGIRCSGSMTTSELVKALSERLGVSQRQARTLLDGYTAAISRQLGDKNSVIIRNFGSFNIKEIPEKLSYVPAKSSHCLIPAHLKLHFKPAKKLKEEVNETASDE